MSFNERRKTKSKIKSQPNPRIEALRVTVEKKKQCNDKALQIVTDLSEGTISEDALVDSLKFINQEHYQDIVEERAINKLCGYPVCSKLLKNIPSKQYHISTTLNKVFDITDRKNFCSNLCYKASKFLKDQILTSPLWLREEEEVTAYKFISLESRGGISGDEVDLGVNAVKLEVDDLKISDKKQDENSVSKVDNKIDTKEIDKNDMNNPTTITSNDEKSVVEESVAMCSSSCENTLNDNISPLKNECEQSKLHDSREETCSDSNKINCTNVVREILASQATEHHESESNHVTRKLESLNINNPLTIEKEIDASVSYNQKQTQNKLKRSHKHSTKKKSSNDQSKSDSISPIQNLVLKVEQILREWISIDTLCFILGEEKIKEILAEKKDQNLPVFTQDIHFYERYLAICKKLNMLELEDTRIDAAYRDEPKKPLPDYEALKEEARQMDIKVKMFFKGDKVQFEDPELKKETEASGAVDVQPVLPLVDVHAQKALRRRIVIDKLRRVLQDLQKSLGLKGFNLTEDVRTLVGTLTLSAHNVMMKPAVWNLVTIAVIKLLSLRDGLLSQALGSSTANRHLTLLLMSYSLDAGYLDRLMVWLTDVEAVLHKT